MSENMSAIIPQQGATNETLLGDLTSYFRWNEETRNYEMNVRISPLQSNESWVVVPSPLRDALVNPDRRPAVGSLVYDWWQSAQRANREAAAAAEIRQQAWRCMEIIGDRLNQEAENRGWCDEFDRIIDEVNDDLPGGFQLPVREREYEVTWTQTVTVTVGCSATFTARNADEAADLARDYDEAVDTESIIAAVRYGNYEEDYDGADGFDVTEV